MAPSRLPPAVRKFLVQEAGYRAGIGQDLDSIKHVVRGIQWKLDALVEHFKVSVSPDALQPIVNPLPSFISDIIHEARGGFASRNASEVKPKKKRAFRRKKKVRARRKAG
jgi:hypothetical protein